jgi:succinoglycan biosynthesis transport protein ExoP
MIAAQPRTTEAYRRLRTMIDVADVDHRGVKMLASPGTGDGTTTVLINLGIALASPARPVLLIDANLYRPRLHIIFALTNYLGLTSVIADDVPLEAASQSLPDYPGVRVLTSGPVSADPAEIFSMPGAKPALEMAGLQSPVVLMDGPALLPHAGGVTLAGVADSVIIVVRAGRTTRSALAAAHDLVQRTGTPVLGVVLNGVTDEGAHLLPHHRGRSSDVRGAVLNRPKGGDYPAPRGTTAPSSASGVEVEHPVSGPPPQAAL